MKARGKKFGTLLWKVDGSLALREAIMLCHTGASNPNIAMDYFHLMYGVRNQKMKLGTHYGNVCHHVRLLAEMTDGYSSRAIQAVLVHWKRNGLSEFASYFESTWVEKRGGWWCTSLGPGTPGRLQGPRVAGPNATSTQNYRRCSIKGVHVGGRFQTMHCETSHLALHDGQFR